MTRLNGSLLVLALVPLLAATTRPLVDITWRIYGPNGNGTYTKVNEFTTAAEGTGTVGMLCATPSTCVWCATCHGPQKKLTATKHFTTYFPKAEYRLAEGQRMRFGDSRLSVLLSGGLLYFVDAGGRRFAVAPAGSRVLRDAHGAPTLVFINGAPRVLVR